MNKAILVIDMPDSCDDCNFCYYSDGRVPICFYKSWVVDEPKAKPDWCPLKPVPEKYDVLAAIENNPNYDPSYDIGHNDCIDDIIGT